MSKYIDVHISIPEEIRTTFKNMHDKIESDRRVAPYPKTPKFFPVN